MTAKEISEELISDYKLISFGVGYKYDLSKEDQIKNLRYCLLFSNQMIVNCQKEYRDIYIDVIKILNDKIEQLKK